MKLLLTSAGIQNDSIRRALVDLLGKPIEECAALAIPTAQYGHPAIDSGGPVRFLTGLHDLPMCALGWRSLGMLELTALPTMDPERWTTWVREADVLLAAGGDGLYLAHWMRESGLAELVATLPDLVWVGLSGGGMALTPRVGDFFVASPPLSGEDRGLGLVDFSFFPHVDHPALPGNTMAAAEEWAAGIGGPAYAIDDQTAIQVTAEGVEVVSEGHWRFFADD